MIKRRLAIESLEGRMLMAGNVTASIVSGELRIIGNSAANWVEIRQLPGADGTGRTFVIGGRDFNGAFNANGDPVAGTAPTRVNGGLRDVVLKTPLDTIRVVLGAGNDAVEIGTQNSGMTAAGLVIDTGDGRDHAKLERVTMNGGGGSLVIKTGPAGENADNKVELEHVFLASRALNIYTGGGDDRVIVDRVIAASLTVQLGAGNDFVDLRERTDITNRVLINGAAGTDHLHIGEAMYGELIKQSVEVTSSTDA